MLLSGSVLVVLPYPLELSSWNTLGEPSQFDELSELTELPEQELEPHVNSPSPALSWMPESDPRVAQASLQFIM